MPAEDIERLDSIQEEAEHLRSLKSEHTEAKEKTKELREEFERRQWLLLERMEQEKVEGLKVDGINFVPTETIYAKVADRRAFIEWAIENDPELIEQKERKAVLNEFVRQKLDDGEPLPPGMDSRVDSYISQRAA